MPRSARQPPTAVLKTLRQLGTDLRDARRRRRIPTAVLADRVAISRSTLRRVERGDFGGQPRYLRDRLLGARFVRPLYRSRRAGPRSRGARARRRATARTHRGAARAVTGAHSGEAVSEPSAFVYVELDGVTHRVGRLWVSTKGRETATFEYDADWLADPRHFALEPALPQRTWSVSHTLPGRPLFGALGDSAPDHGDEHSCNALRHGGPEPSDARNAHCARSTTYLASPMSSARVHCGLPPLLTAPSSPRWAIPACRR